MENSEQPPPDSDQPPPPEPPASATPAGEESAASRGTSDPEPEPPTTGGDAKPEPSKPDPAKPADGNDPTPPSPPTTGGVTPAAMRPRSSTAAAEEELAQWQQWWYAHEERYLRVRSRVRAAEARNATNPRRGIAGHGAPAAAAPDFEAAARETLHEALTDRERTVRSAAAIALGRSGTTRAFHDLLKLFTQRREDVRRSAGVGMGLLHEPLAAASIGKVLMNPREDEDQRTVAAMSLGLIGGPDAAAELVRFLDPASDSLRRGGLRRTPALQETAVVALGLSGHAPAAATLVKILANPNAHDRTRALAATALSRLGDRKVIPAVIHALHADPEVIRRSAAAALGLLATSTDENAVTELVLAAQKDRDPSTRRYAMFSLARVGGDAARASLKKILAGADTGDRPFAALAVGVSRSADARPALVAMLRDEKNADTRGALALAIGLLSDRDAPQDLVDGASEMGNAVLRGHYLTALALANHEGLAKVSREVLATEDFDGLRLRAAVCLAIAGEKDAQSIVLEATKKGCCPNCRGEAARVLGIIGSTTSLPALKAIIRDAKEAPLRSEAVWALGRILDKQEISTLAALGMDAPFPLFRGPLRAAMRL